MSTELIKQFAQYGGYIGLLTGVLIAAAFAAIAMLWKQLKADRKAATDNIENLHKTCRESIEGLHKEYQQVIADTSTQYRDQLTQLQEARVSESKEVSDHVQKIIVENNEAVRGLTSTITLLRDVIISRSK